MEEKNEVKVRLSTVLYLFIIVVLVIALGVVYYLGFVKNDNSNNMIANGEVEDEISDSKVDEIAKDLFEKGSKKIREAQYTDYYQYDIAQPLTEKTINGVTYQKRNVLYSNVEKEYSEIFTGNALKKVLGKRFAEIDGYLYVSYGGATGWDVTNIKVSRVSENNNEIEYTITYNDVEIDDSISEEYSCKMTVKLVDGDYRILKTDYLGLDNPEIHNNVEETVEDNGSEQGLKKYKGKEAISMIAKEDTKFVINEIKNNGDTYIISASILEKEPRKVLEKEYKNILDGQEVTFRDRKWKYDKSSDCLRLTQNYNNMQTSKTLALRSSNDEGINYFENIAGVVARLCDYSDIKVEFKVSKDIKVCSFFGEFKYDNGKLVCKNIDDESMEITPQTIDTLIEFCNNNEPGTSGSYEECIAYVSNGNVDAIKIFEK